MLRLIVIGLSVSSIGSARDAQRYTSVRDIDWANRVYTNVYDGADPVTVTGGEGLLDGLRLTVDRPRFADIDGDGRDDAIVVEWRESQQGHSASAVEIFTLRRGVVVRLARIEGGEGLRGGIDHIDVDGRALIVVRYAGALEQRERWRWKAGKLTEDVRERRMLE
jgi:hypothetical protein